MSGDDDADLPERTMMVDGASLAGGRGLCLVYRQGEAEHRVPILPAGITIGRGAECDVVLPVPALSRQHCRVERDGDGARLVDLGSTNGTFVNGARVTEPVGLSDGMLIRLGGLELRFEANTRISNAAPPPPPPQPPPSVTSASPPTVAEAHPERHLAAILVTDVVGFSRMMGIDEVGTLVRMAEVRRAIIDPAMAACRGRIFKEVGDGLLAEFSSAVLALSAAMQIQIGCAKRNQDLPAAEHIVLRIGVHQGEVLRQGTDLMGDGVNVAARLEPLARAGGICVSERVREDAGGKLQFDFEDIGEVALKNIGRPVRVHRVYPPGTRPPPAPEAPAPQDASAAQAFEELLPVVRDSKPTTLFRRMGRKLALLQAAAVVLALLAGSVWWEWDELAKKPLIGQFIGWLSQKPIVAAKPGHLTIALAHLEGDSNDEHEKLLLDRLTNDFEGADTTQIDRTIAVPEAVTTQDGLAQAKAAAGALRAQAGADVLLWGRVVKLGNSSAMRLYWTTGEAVSGAKASGVYGVQTDTVALPDLFWSDLKQVLGLLLQSRLALVRKQMTGHYAADKMAPLITQVRKLLAAQQGNWGADTDAKVRETFADALSSYGDQAGNDDALREAIDAYNRVLTELSRQANPLDWARAQHSLGDALLFLGQREDGTARLLASVAAYRAALEERTRARAPLEWAQTQNGLGNALELLGERETGTQHLEESVTAYRAALEERTRERVPMDWARVENNLGNALLSLGQRERGTGRLREAVTALKAALEERTRARVPLAWADTQTNLATSLVTLAEREVGDPAAQMADLRLSVTTVTAALEEEPKDKVPFYWAMSQQTLGHALRALGEHSAGTAELQQSAAASRAALDVFTRDEDPLDWADVQNSLGMSLRLWGERETGTDQLTDAVTAFSAALSVRRRDHAPLDWAQTQANLGATLRVLANRAHDPARMADALACLRGAVEVYQAADDQPALQAARQLLLQTQADDAKLHP